MPRPFDLLPTLLQGVWITALVYLGAAAFVLVFSLVIGLMRSSKRPWLRWPASLYIQALRGTPALVLLFWFYFVMPVIGVQFTALVAGILALGLNYAAYGGELVRGAIAAVPKGQTEAAVALNFTRTQQLVRVIIPQAAVRVLPPFGNLNIELLKNTALVFFIGLHDLTFQGKILQVDTQRTVEIFSLALVLYFIMALCITGVARLSEHLLSRGLRAGGS